MLLTIVDQENNQVIADLSNDLVVGEVIQSDDGQFYEVKEINDEQIVVELVEVEEDWGE